MNEKLLVMKDIYKVYGNGVVANNKVNFDLNKGEIHSLVGENGAGKSTLMKILFGIEGYETGSITLNGNEFKVQSPLEAIKNGIGMVHQHFMLVPSLTVTENIMLGIEETQGLFIDREKTRNYVSEISKKYNLVINPDAIVADLTVGEMQKVEILKSLARGVDILILDEPTAVLTPQETTVLFKQLEVLKEKGITIVFISHKLKEIKQISDRITVMMSGRVTGTFENNDEISVNDISQLMVGRESIKKIEKIKANYGDVILEVSKVSQFNQYGLKCLDNVSFNLKEGQIIGIAGVDGNGQDELIELITGDSATEIEGDLLYKNESLIKKNIYEKRTSGISYIPSDRMKDGCSVNHSIAENLLSTFTDSDLFGKGIFFDENKIKDISNEQIKMFKVKAQSKDQNVGMLSGGNIQKVVVARELLSNPDLIIAEQPTRGIDVGAANLIHHELLKLRDQGKAIIIVSADLNELMELSDSLVVMCNGKCTAYIENSKDISEEELGYYMLGLKEQGSELNE